MDVVRARGGTPTGDSDVEVALLDLDGVIVSANQAWYDFCLDNGGDVARCGVGSSYLAACAAAGTDATATAVLDAIRSALAGQVVAPITLQIPCDAPGEPRWFDLLVSSRSDADGDCIGATVTLSRSQASRKPIDRPDAPSAEVQYPDRPRLAMEGLVAELGQRVQDVLDAQARLHALLRANAALAAEADLSSLLDLVISLGRDVMNAGKATLVPASVQLGEPAPPAPSTPSTPSTPPIETSGPSWTAATGEVPPPGSLTVPIMVAGELFTTLALGDSPNGQFSREDQWLANEFAASAGVAIRNAQLVADSDRRRRWQQALTDATRALVADDPDQPLEVVSRFAAVGARGETAAVCIAAGAGPVDAGVEVMAAHGSRASLDLDAIDAALQSGAPVVNDTLLIAPLTVAAVRRPNGATVDGVARVIVVARTHADRPFEQADLDQLGIYAHQIALALSLRTGEDSRS